MTLLDTTEVFIEFSDIERRVPPRRGPGKSRSPGLHVSDILQYAWYGSLEGEDRDRKKKEADEDLEILPLRMALGLAWEEWVAGLYPEMEWQPGELEKDGIIGSPDGISNQGLNWSNRLPCLEEYKCTWKSMRGRDILKETLWLWQSSAYAYLIGTRYARLHVCWINGDYSHSESWGPRYFKYLIEFQEHELKRIWTEVFLKNKEKISAWTK